jgi:hypothetical protein
MSLTLKHRDDGSFYEQGDTQGLVVPGIPDFCQGSFASLSLPANVTTVLTPIPDLSLGVGGRWFDSANKRFTVPKDGSYSISYFPGKTTGPNGYAIASVSAGGKNFTNNMNSSSTGVYSPESSISATIYLSAGQFITFSMYCNSAYTVPAGGFFNITKLDVRMPYLVANKGALFSGGAFQFDVDGNGYTKNYSTNEIKIGKWIDGTDIYQKTFSLPSALTTWDYQNASLPYPEQFPNNIIDYECILQSSIGTYTDIEISWTNWHDINFSYPTAVGGTFIWFYVTLRYKGKWF